MRCPKDWDQQCPNSECARFKLMNRGNVSAISTYLTASGKASHLLLSGLPHDFLGNPRHRLLRPAHPGRAGGIMALKMLLVRVDLAGISCVLGVTEETVSSGCAGRPQGPGDQHTPASRASRHTGAARRDVEFRCT